MKNAAVSSPASSPPPAKRQNSAAKVSESEDSEAINNGLKVFFDQEQLAKQKDLEKREAALKLAEQQLEEAKKAAPALFAKPGDKFTFHSNYADGEELLIEYVGRNTTKPRKADFGGDHNYQSPGIGWLIFRSTGGYPPAKVVYRGLRDLVGAWPIAAYSHYDEEKMITDTLCIPPEMCGDLKPPHVWDDADY